MTKHLNTHYYVSLSKMKNRLFHKVIQKQELGQNIIDKTAPKE